MKRITLLKFLLPLFLLLAPAPALIAQTQSDNGTSGLSLNGEEDKKDKKKNKDDGKEDQTDAEFFSFNIEKFSSAFFARLLINLVSVAVLIQLIYLPVYRRRDQLFTFYMFNLTIFIITFLLNKKDSAFSSGAAFGLFAVFSLLRYRTEDISARDMTYLFGVIALGLISSVNRGNIVEISVINAIILLAAFILDGNVLMKTEFIKTIQYENIEMIKPENHQLLMEDLRKRTGLNVHKVSIGRIDFLRDTASIKIYYYENNNQDA